MKFSQAKTRFSCWITLCVMLFATLAPSVSMALAARAGEFIYLGEICSARKSQVDDTAPFTSTSQGSKHDTQGKHCSLCLPHASDYQYLADSEPTDFALVLSADFPSLYFQSRFLTHAWSPASARAPPFR